VVVGAVEKKVQYSWDDNYSLVQDFMQPQGKMPRQKDVYKDVKIGSWCSQQRLTYNTGKISIERKQKLESINGWSWGSTGKI
jgi:hypothetical protein